MIKDILLVEDDLSFALGMRMQLEELYPRPRLCIAKAPMKRLRC